MSDIKVGEYVRTKEGYIGKLVEITPNTLNYLKIDIGREIIHCDNSRDDFIYTRYGFQLKHSSNIIDLIEVGDYVNGEIITEITTDPFVKGQINLWTDMELRDVYGDYDRLKYTAQDIESIVTKEQFKEVEYKVNE